MVAPARLELWRTSPAIVVDTAHDGGRRVTIEACREVFAFQPLIGVIGMMADKDAAGVLEIFASAMDQVVVTRARGTSRSCLSMNWCAQTRRSGPPGRCRRPRALRMRWSWRRCWLMPRGRQREFWSRDR